MPQFHPIPENDIWWGKGFTEWTNVTKSKPLFEGHHQPHLPTDLGFYDLRLHEIMEQQAALARENGIYGFCFYHYWFNEKRLLNLPIDNWLKNKNPDFPFMLCWANENWTRKWDGLENELLIKQEYGREDDIKHINFLLDIFEDKRYIRIENKPVFIIYKPFEMPNAGATIRLWREIAARRGMELYLCHMLFCYRQERKMMEGFDAAIDFEPYGIRKESPFSLIHKKRQQGSLLKVLNKFKHLINYNRIPYEMYNIVDYELCYENLQPLKELESKIFPSIVPGWDNTSRKNTNPHLILYDNTPQKFEIWLKKIEADFEPYSAEENFLFINAWNEWAEGNHLEPCRKFGHGFLDVLKNNFL